MHGLHKRDARRRAAAAPRGATMALCASLGLAGLVSAQTSLDALDKGRYVDDGSHAAASKTTYTGRYDTSGFPIDYDYSNAYFVFDLTGVSQPVTTATLELFVQAYYDIVGVASKRVDVFSVTNTPAAVMAGYAVADPLGATIYQDLGTGETFGRGTVRSVDAGHIIEIALNPAGIAELNAKRGQTVAIGLRLDMIPEIQWNEYVRFYFNAGDGPHRLVLNGSTTSTTSTSSTSTSSSSSTTSTSTTTTTTSTSSSTTSTSSSTTTSSSTSSTTTTSTTSTTAPPSRISSVAYTNGAFRLFAASLQVGRTVTVLRSASPRDANWATGGQFVAQTAATNWTDATALSNAFYRLRQ